MPHRYSTSWETNNRPANFARSKLTTILEYKSERVIYDAQPEIPCVLLSVR